MNWCRFGFHKWPKWSAPVNVTWKQRYVRWGVEVGEWEEAAGYMQTRTCERCGEYEKNVSKGKFNG